MDENGYRRAVEKPLKQEGIYCLKLNLHRTQSVADSWYSGIGGDLWVEWKYRKTHPARPPWKTGATELQAHWLNERYNEGRQVALVIGLPEQRAMIIDRPPFLVSESVESIHRQELVEWIKAKCT